MPQIKRMEMEARSFSADRARSLLVKVKEYKADLAALRTEFKKVLQTLVALTRPAAAHVSLKRPLWESPSAETLIFVFALLLRTTRARNLQLACSHSRLAPEITVTSIPQVSASGPAGASARAELGLEDDFYSTSAGQREKALASTDRLNKTGDRIQHGRQQLLETEARDVALASWAPCGIMIA